MAPKKDEPAVDELSAAHYLIGRFFPLLDCENDQLVDAGEIDMHLAAMFGPLDRDRSLSLSKSELVSSPAGTPAYRYQARVFELADRNGDGIISSREFRDHMAHSFALVDANHDGDLRAEEIRPVP
ncbi:MAG: hypothetical protein KDK91_08090 [Gammaproteobacteria bacterium]|nr:hypothetical protein [Gammaproteobacteria bacterium]